MNRLKWINYGNAIAITSVHNHNCVYVLLLRVCTVYKRIYFLFFKYIGNIWRLILFNRVEVYKIPWSFNFGISLYVIMNIWLIEVFRLNLTRQKSHSTVWCLYVLSEKKRIIHPPTKSIYYKLSRFGALFFTAYWEAEINVQIGL